VCNRIIAVVLLLGCVASASARAPSIVLKTCSLSASPRRVPIHAWSKDQPPLPNVGVAAPNTGP
jgi:hypothetical protein